jgi:hypothetical protein
MRRISRNLTSFLLWTETIVWQGPLFCAGEMSPSPARARLFTGQLLTAINYTVQDLQRIQRRVGGDAKVMLFGEFAGSRVQEIDDPYYGASDGFDVAYEQCVRFSTNFLRQMFPHAKP